jgi:hypothetical protein
LRILRVEKEIIYNNFPARALALADATGETASSREKYVSAKRAFAFLEVFFYRVAFCAAFFFFFFSFDKTAPSKFFLSRRRVNM